MENNKRYVLLAILALYGQAVYLLWGAEYRFHLTVRCFVIMVGAKLLGDFLGRFVFRFEQYDWVYLRDYVMNNFALRISVLIIFTLFWLIAVLFVDFWDMNGSIVDFVISGGLFPTIYYGWINRHQLAKSETQAHRMKRKL